MAKITGIVEQVATKEVTTKFGVKPTFSFKINGMWVKTGFKNHNASAGDQVEFDGESGTYGMETKGVAIISKGTGVAPSAGASVTRMPVSTGGGSYAGGRVFPIPALHGDRSIIRQNALARSVELFIGAHGGKNFTVEDGTISYLIKAARQFEAYTAGDLDLADAKTENAAEEAVAKAA